MIKTKDLTFIHTAKCGGSFVSDILLREFEGMAVGPTFHTPRSKIKFNTPVFIGTVRNPFEWYVSMYHFYTEKENPIISGLGDFKSTVTTLLNLRGTPKHKELQSCDLKDNAIGFYFDKAKDGIVPRGGYTNQDFIDYPSDDGFFSWLWKRMNSDENGVTDDVHIMRVENLNNDLVDTLDKFSEISKEQKNRILGYSKMNTTVRRDYREYYDSELIDLVYKNEGFILSKFGYEF
jgi:hypothetical protein